MFVTPAMVAVALLTLIAAAIFLTVPRSTIVHAGQFEIRSPLHTWTYPLTDVVSAEPVTLDPLRTVRLGSSGWPLPPVGWMRDKAHGTFRALASSRRNLHMLRFRDGRLLLISLADAATLTPAAL